MRPPRFRVRTLLVAVAVVGVVLGFGIEAARLLRLARAYRQRAARHARLRVECSELTLDQVLFSPKRRPRPRTGRPGVDAAWGGIKITVQSHEPDWLGAYGRPEVTYDERGWAREALRHACLEEKYLRAAARPWLPIPPDRPPPPEPKLRMPLHDAPPPLPPPHAPGRRGGRGGAADPLGDEGQTRAISGSLRSPS